MEEICDALADTSRAQTLVKLQWPSLQAHRHGVGKYIAMFAGSWLLNSGPAE